MRFLQALPFDENPDEPMAVRIRQRAELPFDHDFLHQCNMSQAGKLTSFGSLSFMC